MASTLALGPVHAAILARLRASAALLAVVPVARITDQPAATTMMPYVLVEMGDETPFNTMGGTVDSPKFGGVVGVRVRVVSQFRGDSEAALILDLVKSELDGRDLTVAGYPTAIVAFERADLLKDTVGSVVTRELVGTFSVTAHQSA
jgi:hypothetical protein